MFLYYCLDKWINTNLRTNINDSPPLVFLSNVFIHWDHISLPHRLDNKWSLLVDRHIWGWVNYNDITIGGWGWSQNLSSIRYDQASPNQPASLVSMYKIASRLGAGSLKERCNDYFCKFSHSLSPSAVQNCPCHDFQYKVLHITTQSIFILSFVIFSPWSRTMQKFGSDFTRCSMKYLIHRNTSWIHLAFALR